MRHRVIQTIIERTIDLVFPPSPDMLRVRRTEGRSYKEFLHPPQIGDVSALTQFTDKDIEALIHEAKFHGNIRAFKFLGKLLSEYLSEKEILDGTVVLPIPLSTTRSRSRGYNQVTEVVRHAIADRKDLVLNTRALVRVRDTKPQTTLRRAERLLNMENAFKVIDPVAIAHRHIILVDDVTTTGATLRAAKGALLPYSPASVTCIALAH